MSKDFGVGIICGVLPTAVVAALGGLVLWNYLGKAKNAGLRGDFPPNSLISTDSKGDCCVVDSDITETLKAYNVMVTVGEAPEFTADDVGGVVTAMVSSDKKPTDGVLSADDTKKASDASEKAMCELIEGGMALESLKDIMSTLTSARGKASIIQKCWDNAVTAYVKWVAAVNYPADDVNDNQYVGTVSLDAEQTAKQIAKFADCIAEGLSDARRRLIAYTMYYGWETTKDWRRVVDAFAFKRIPAIPEELVVEEQPVQEETSPRQDEPHQEANDSRTEQSDTDSI